MGIKAQENHEFKSAVKSQLILLDFRLILKPH